MYLVQIGQGGSITGVYNTDIYDPRLDYEPGLHELTPEQFEHLGAVGMGRLQAAVVDGAVVLSPSLAWAKRVALAKINKTRERTLRTAESLGRTYDVDNNSLGRINLAAAVASQQGVYWGTAWVTADNRVVTLSQYEMLALARDAAAHIAATILAARQQKDAVLAATSIAEIDQLMG